MMYNKLFDFISSKYAPADYPALKLQAENFCKTRPLAGLKILDATPIFCNTLVKYYALLCAGAELTVAAGKDIPFDREIISMLNDFGISTDLNGKTFDLIADCAGRHRHIPARLGYVELTRSGLEYYQDCKLPVISADTGIVKTFETVLGTGDGFVRAMRQLQFGDFANKNILIFGGGKVGMGIKYQLDKLGANTAVADLKFATETINGNVYINANEPETVRKYIRQAWCIVAVTGLANALKPWAEDLTSSSALIANMGVEDEFSEAVPDSRVLNSKRPLNFILPEPTLLRCIDPVMALSNYSLLSLANGKLSGKSGIFSPLNDDENLVLQSVDDEFKKSETILRNILEGKRL
jgi:adenosylhomocysteinase